jgi:hypothetical protein
MDVEKVLGNLSLNAKKRLAVITESKPFFVDGALRSNRHYPKRSFSNLTYQ